MVVWCALLTLLVAIQAMAIVGLAKTVMELDDEIEAIKSWYPFVEICKMRIPKEDE